MRVLTTYPEYFDEDQDGTDEQEQGIMWSLRRRFRSWPFRGWGPPAKKSPGGNAFSSIFEASQEKRSSKRKTRRSEVVFRPTSSASNCLSSASAWSSSSCRRCFLGFGEDDQDCPCGGCKVWGERTRDKPDRTSVMSELTLTLLRHNIDTRLWGHDGRKNAWDMVWEIQNGVMILKVDQNEKNKRIKRFARNLRIHLHADTKDQGVCVVQEQNMKVEGKYITKKMGIDDQDWRSKTHWVLQKYFKLDKEFISRYVVVLNHKVVTDESPSFYYPGLMSNYTIHEVDLWIVNGLCHDVMGLPWGKEFTTSTYDAATIKQREQHWEWDPYKNKESIKQQLLRAYAYGAEFYKLDLEDALIENQEKKKVKRNSQLHLQVQNAQDKTKAGMLNAMRRRGTVAAAQHEQAAKELAMKRRGTVAVPKLNQKPATW